jgi:hypothetical protein
MDSNHYRSQSGADDEAIPLQSLPQPSGGVGGDLDHDSTTSSQERNLNMKDESSEHTQPLKLEYVRRQRTSLVFIALYLPLLLIPFPMTAVMVYRPLNLPS